MRRVVPRPASAALAFLVWPLSTHSNTPTTSVRARVASAISRSTSDGTIERLELVEDRQQHDRREPREADHRDREHRGRDPPPLVGRLAQRQEHHRGAGDREHQAERHALGLIGQPVRPVDCVDSP